MSAGPKRSENEETNEESNSLVDGGPGPYFAYLTPRLKPIVEINAHLLIVFYLTPLDYRPILINVQAKILCKN